jgi:hypothetical protein
MTTFEFKARDWACKSIQTLAFELLNPFPYCLSLALLRKGEIGRIYAGAERSAG